MQNENSRVNEVLPTDSGTAGRSIDHDQTAAGATEDESSPREDAAETTRDHARSAPRLENSTGPSPENPVGSRCESGKTVLPDGGRVQAISKAEVKELRRELSKFQIRVLEILAEDSRYGLAIKRELEDYSGVDVNHGRLYPNLNELSDLELVEISELDKRTNNYELTETARAFLEDDLEWSTERVNGGDGA